MTNLKTAFISGSSFLSGITTDSDKLNGITYTINSKAYAKLSNERNINLVSATYAGELAGSDQYIIDKFLDADGQNDTVDTGNTTAAYDAGSDYYECAAGYADAIVQSAAVTIPAGKTLVYVTPLLYEALTGDDAITVDVSINGGTNYTTGLDINKLETITSATGTSLIIKLNLDTDDGSTTPKVIGWCVLLE